MAEHSSFATAANIFAAPNEAFEAIKQRPTALLPLLVLITAYCAVSFAYTTAVDVPWMIEQQLESSGAQMSDAERAQAVRAATAIQPAALGAIGAVASSIFLVLWIFVVALYYTGISFATNDGIKLKQWFSLISWCALPLVLGVIATIVNVLAGDVRFVMQDEINPLSFGNLFSIKPEEPSMVQRVLVSLDVTAMWTIALTVLAYQAWTKRSLVKSVAIVLGPLAAIVLITTLFTLL